MGILDNLTGSSSHLSNISNELAEYKERFEREKLIRIEAEQLLEAKSLDLYHAKQAVEEQNRTLQELNDKVTTQSEELRQIVEELSATIEHKEIIRKELQTLNQSIMDSVIYSQRIQNALLPTSAEIKQLLPKSMLVYLPKNIVSGDFFWVEAIHNKILLVVADCTGHGVPGAFMSILGISAIQRMVDTFKNVYNTTHNFDNFPAHQLLYQLNQDINRTLNRDRKHIIKDGMDIAILILDIEHKKLQFVGANRPLWIIRNSEISEIKGQRASVGHNEFAKLNFDESHEISVEDGDKFYIFTDGITDQFGGEFKRKLTPKRLRNFLIESATLDFTSQEHNLLQWLAHWQQNTKEKFEQTDDITLLGFSL